MDVRLAIHLYFLVLGSLLCAVLGKIILKFYSSIPFNDRNIFTYLNISLVVSLQVAVHSRVGDDPFGTKLSSS